MSAGTPKGNTSARQVLDEAMSEKDLQTFVEGLLKLRGWLWYHTYDSRRSQKGFPDIVAVRGGRLLFIELKREKEKPTPEQREWIDALKVAVSPLASVYVWRPSDMDEIERRLL